MRTFSFLLFLCFFVFLENSYCADFLDGATEPLIEGDSGQPSLQIHPISDFDTIQAEHISANPGISREVAEIDVTCNPSNPCAFIVRSFDQYAHECASAGKPTRLVVGCGHAGSPNGDGFCPGHSTDYFTLNICLGRNPDILGNVFRMESLIFQPNSWDFVIFECFPWGQYFTDKNLRMIANSLRPNGAWVLSESKNKLPYIIKIANDYSCGRGEGSLVRCNDWNPDGFHGIFYTICQESRKMKNQEECRAVASNLNFGDLVVFDDFEDLHTTIDNYFTRFGFGSARILTQPEFFLRDESISGLFESPAILGILNSETGEKLTLDLSKWKFVRMATAAVPSPLTGEIIAVDSSNPKPSFGAEVDALAGEEFMNLHKGYLSDFVYVVRN